MDQNLKTKKMNDGQVVASESTLLIYYTNRKKKKKKKKKTEKHQGPVVRSLQHRWLMIR